jgi:hypothetical protein
MMVCVTIAVKTDKTGGFTLPPVRGGSYLVWVTDQADDYSRAQGERVTGIKPPPILPRMINFGAKDKTREITFREGKSITVRGTVRRADGSPVSGVQVDAYMQPADWEVPTDLDSTHTDAAGHYVLRLPAPVEGVRILTHNVSTPDGWFLQFKSVGPHAGASDRTVPQPINFDLLTDDVKDADWVENPLFQ